METAEKCRAILTKILEHVNADRDVRFTSDWSGNSAKVYVGKSHNHVGMTDATFDEFVDELYNVLHGGPGLTWYPETPGKETE